ncbi:hypothetical protein D3C87_1367260 [compost metagenome]
MARRSNVRSAVTVAAPDTATVTSRSAATASKYSATLSSSARASSSHAPNATCALSARARNSMFSIIRASRSYSSRFDSSSDSYSAGLRRWASVTCVCPTRLLIGVRKSCARSAENAERRVKLSCNRASMPLSAPASSRSSSGAPPTSSRVASRLVVTAAASLAMRRSGLKPRRASR